MHSDWPSRNKRCGTSLGEGVAVFYEPLKFYSSLHRGSLRPQGHYALNKLPSFLYRPPPQYLLSHHCPPSSNPSTHRLNGLFIVWCSSLTSSFFPSLSLFLCFLLSTRVRWRGGLSDVVRPHVCTGCVDSVCMWVRVHACARTTHVQCLEIPRVFPLLLCCMGAYWTVAYCFATDIMKTNLFITKPDIFSLCVILLP